MPPSNVAPEEAECRYNVPPQVFDFTEYLSDISTSEAAGGSFGIIYRAGLGNNGKKFLAAKVLRRFLFKNEADFVKSFNYEIQAWTKIGYHQYVLQLFGIAYTNKCSATPHPCFLSEWQENGELRDYAKDTNNIDLLTVLSQVAQGLKHMHSQNVIHGDLRGGNILVAKDGTPRIADFGLSKVEGLEASTSFVKGTLRWMAAELVSRIESSTTATSLRLMEKRSKASDVWSLGMTFLEILSGLEPYYNIYYEHWVIFSIEQGDLPKYSGPFSESWRHFDRQVLNICEKCWSLDVSSRPSTNDLCSKLEALLLKRGRHESQSAGIPETADVQAEEHSVEAEASRASHRSSPEIISQRSLGMEVGNSAETRSISPPPSPQLTDGHRPLTIDLKGRSKSPEPEFEVVKLNFSSLSLPPSPDDMSKQSLSCKTCLLNIAAKKKISYKFSSREVGDHLKQWECKVICQRQVCARARAHSKKEAEEDASRQILSELSDEDPGISVFLPRYSPIFKRFLEENNLTKRIQWYPREEGEAHNPTWRFIVECDGQAFAEGASATKREAEEAATRAAARIWRSQA